MTDAATARPSALLRLTSLALPVLRYKHTMLSEVRTRAEITASDGKEFAAPPRRAASRLALSEAMLGGLRTMILEPRGPRPAARPLVFLHGGGFVHQFETAHWWLTTALAHDLRVRIYAPDYLLLPRGTAKQTVAAVAGVVRDVARLAGAAPILAGDSAGGGLAVAVAARLRGTPDAPAHLALFAPWLDLALRHPEIPALERRDPSLAATGLRIAGELWAGALGVDHPDASPALADPAGLPPISLVAGTRDILYPDARDFAARARAAGVDVAAFTAADAFHVFVAATGLPESAAARVWLTERLAPLVRA
jgi:acetyl esterase/lipase